VFQPHLYSRTRDFYEEFGKAFLLSDVLVVTDIYPAREDPIQGITGELIVHAARQFGHKETYYIPDKTLLPSRLKSIARPGDIMITMGAGDIWKFGEVFLEEQRKGS
jgi:UDP-N-acetylmuramate--alanine ligase